MNRSLIPSRVCAIWLFSQTEELLQLIVPPIKYQKTWSKQITQLDQLSTDFSESISNGSVLKTRSILAKMLSQIKSMESYVKKLNRSGVIKF